MYGITQNSATKDYVIVIKYDLYCKGCINNIQCKSCQVRNLKFFTNWTGENEKIDNFVQEMQLKTDTDISMVFEWIPYSQFSHIKEIGEGGFSKVYFANWKNGPLHYNINEKEYIRDQNKKVALKCIYNSQNITNEFLNEV